jgi:outer membrane protein OmpA-like peptidoglycan-associated protein
MDPQVDLSSTALRRIQQMKGTTIAIAMLLTAAPALAGTATPDDASRAGPIGILSGAVLGAVLGGPPGAIAGMAAGGVSTDWYLQHKRNADLGDRMATLTAERNSLQSERRSMRASLAELEAALAQHHQHATEAAETGLLADGLELEIGFRTDSAMLPDGSDEALDALARLVLAVPAMEIQLDGYADPRGGERHNRQLSLARAEAVRDRLVGAGIPAERIRLAAHGATASLEPGAVPDPDGWALERRVTLRLETAEGRLAARP